MRRLLASGLLPRRAGQPVKALVHIYFAELCQMDPGSALQDTWIAAYRAQWAAHRAAASVRTGDGGAWLEGDAARAVACDAMIIPVVTGDLDAGAVEALIGLCVQYHRVRARAAAGGPDGGAGTAATRDRADGRASIAAGDGPDAPGGAAGPDGDGTAAAPAAGAAEVLAMLEHQILGTIIRVVSGPGGVASFLRRNLL